MEHAPAKGAFIVLEGLDGSGSTTQLALLEKYLKDKGHTVHTTREPTDSMIGGLIRSIIKGHWKTSPKALQMLFASDRAHHVENEILPKLQDGNIVLSDRYYFSSFAYGGVDLPMLWLRQMNEHFPAPDLAIVVKTPIDQCVEHIAKSRYDVQVFAHEEALKRVMRNYEQLASLYPALKIVDGGKPLKEVFEDVRAIVDKFLANRS